jgi:Na+/H+ antiporter NhaD/arsenite permease-like protein
MLFTLYLLSHGIHIRIESPAGTLPNALFLGIASVFSSIIGTTGASMLFLGPFLKMNKCREKKAHLLIFFIFLVCNIGGLLTPLGDPPLFLGYLHGINFSWFFKNLFFYWALYVFICISIMCFIDKIIIRKEKDIDHNKKVKLEVKGMFNIALIILAVFALFYLSNNLIKNFVLLTICTISFFHLKRHEHKIDFSPFFEVARTFLTIFIVIAPVLFILEKNSYHIHKYITNISENSDGSIIYFWLCSLASSFLDNAPSYLLFFNMAGGNAQELMFASSGILKAISVSAVVMGAMTYIGNAPNMMVRSIAEKKGIKMPSFLGYMLWSCSIIIPISFLISLMLRS